MMSTRTMLTVQALCTAVLLPILAVLPGTASADEAMRLAPGDRVNVSIMNRPELSGEFQVRGDGSIPLHVLGDVAAQGLTEKELATLLEDTLSSQTSLPSSVTVAVTRWRGITVAGDVTTPGTQDFEPGMTVIKATSLAGGIFPRVGETSGGSLELRIASELAEIDRRKVLLADLHARRIRLEAEAAGLDRLSQDNAFAEAAGALAQMLLARQADILSAQRNADAVEIGNAEERAALAETEIDALQQQQRILRAAIAETEASLARAETLLERGLTNADRPLNIKRAISDDNIQLMQAASFEARAAQQRAQAQASIEGLRAARQLELANELYDVQAEIESTVASIAASRALIARVSPYASAQIGTEQALEPPYYRIRRTGADGRVNVLAADIDSALRPGDVLEVKRGGWLENLTD